MQKNDIETGDILAGFILAVLAAGIILGLWEGISAVQDAVRVDSRPIIPLEYRDDYRAAKTLYQEDIQGPTMARKKEICAWCYKSFMVPLPVVRRVDPLLENWIAGQRQEYMFAHKIWEVDPLLVGKY